MTALAYQDGDVTNRATYPGLLILFFRFHI